MCVCVCVCVCVAQHFVTDELFSGTLSEIVCMCFVLIAVFFICA